MNAPAGASSLAGKHAVVTGASRGIGAVIAAVGYRQWASNQRAMRRGEPVRRSALPVVLVACIIAIAILAAVVLLLSAVLRPR